MAESEEELKSLLMKVNEDSEKVSLKLNIQKTKIMISGPITSWEIDGEQWRQCQTLFVKLVKFPPSISKFLLMKVKEESEKAGLKLNIQKTKIMASGSITSW